MQNIDWTNSIYPLPVRITPLPWEDLASVLSRSALAMGYKHVRWLLRPEEGSYCKKDEVCLLRKCTSYQMLERLLLLNEQRLYGMTFHRFSTQLQAPEETFSPDGSEEIQRPLLRRNTLLRFITSCQRSRVCPLCLAEGQCYGHLYWSVNPIVACQRHNILLVDRCPVCLKGIPILRTSLTHCPRCQKGDYRQAPLVPLSNEPFFRGGQAIILGQLEIEDGQAFGMTTLAGPPLSNLTCWQFFRLLDAFRYILCPLFLENSFLQATFNVRTMLRGQLHGGTGLSLNEWLVLVGTFQYIFESWPDNFFQLLDTIPQARDNISGKGITKHFGTFYDRWLYDRLADDCFAFLREAFSDYLKKHYTRGAVNHRLHRFMAVGTEPLQDRRYLTKQEVMKMLGTYGSVNADGRASGVHRLINNGVLRAVKVPLGRTGKRSLYLIEKVDVDVLLCKWDDLLSLETIEKSFLGISKRSLIALTKEGLLTPTRGPMVDGNKKLLYSRAEVERFITLMLKCAQRKSDYTSDGISLVRFRPTETWKLKDTIIAIVNGSLKPVDTETQQPLFQRLILPREEANRFLEERIQHRRVDSKLFTVNEAATRVGVDAQTLLRWINQGLIPADRSHSSKTRPHFLITQETIEAFCKTYVFSEEILELLGITRRALDGHVRRGRLHSLGGYKNKGLFLREEVEALKLSEPHHVARNQIEQCNSSAAEKLVEKNYPSSAASTGLENKLDRCASNPAN